MKCVTEKFRHIIEQLNAHGVCIDFCVFACGPEERETEYIDETFRLIDARRQRHTRAMRAGSMPDRDDFFRTDRHDKRLTSASITWETFIGTEDALPKRIAKDVWSIPGIDGFKTGFINPPHGRSGSGANQRAQLYALFMQEVIGTPAEVEIKSWNTDGCNYFDAGNEWWGSFLWTIRNRRRNELVVIALSATD